MLLIILVHLGNLFTKYISFSLPRKAPARANFGLNSKVTNAFIMSIFLSSGSSIVCICVFLDLP